MRTERRAERAEEMLRRASQSIELQVMFILLTDVVLVSSAWIWGPTWFGIAATAWVLLAPRVIKSFL